MFVFFHVGGLLDCCIQDTFKSWDQASWDRTVLGAPKGSKDPRFPSNVHSSLFHPTILQEDELCREDSEEQDWQDDIPSHIF